MEVWVDPIPFIKWSSYSDTLWVRMRSGVKCWVVSAAGESIIVPQK